MHEKGKVFLLGWNSRHWDWEGKYKELCEASRQGEKYTVCWSCMSSLLQVGDEVFIEKLGAVPKGIMAHGVAVKPSYTLEDADGKDHRYIDVEIDRILDCETEEILLQEKLREELPDQNWSPQASGIAIKASVVPKLMDMWENLIS